MKVVELRLILPVTLDEFKKAHLFTRHKYRKEANDSRSSTSIEKICTYTRSPTPGSSPGDDWFSQHGVFIQYCHTFNNFLPSWANTILGGSALKLIGNTWDEFPVIYSNYQIPAFPKIRIDMKSLHIDNDTGNQHNIFNLSPFILQNRQIIRADLAAEAMSQQSDISSYPTARMCVYVKIECEVGLMLPAQLCHKGEELAMSNIVDVVISLHRLTHLWRQEWQALTLEHIIGDMCSIETESGEGEAATTKSFPRPQSAPPLTIPTFMRATHEREEARQETSARPSFLGRARRIRSRL